MKQILITGAGSYIGTGFKKWMKQYDGYEIDVIDTKNEEWIKKEFSSYDVVFHVAGIAHVDTGFFFIRTKSKKANKDLYYKVNRDLAIEVAKKAKREGVRQFIFMSSIIVYGEHNSIIKPQYITKDTVPKPTNYYGMSKLLAERGILSLQSEDFRVVILRPPMIYGKDCKGNYQKLAKLARITPVFPDIDNKRSMLYIDNLCEFVKLMIENEEKGLFFPQNNEYVETSELVKLISKTYGRKIVLVKIYGLIINIMFRFSIVNKIFGNLFYEKSLSNYNKGDYCVMSFEESIILSIR